MEERAMTAQVEQVKGSVSELASELAAVREQEQAKCMTGEQLQETLMEEQIEKQMGTLEGRMSELAAEVWRSENFDRKRQEALQMQQQVTGEM